jgi:hypothetical protein
VGSCTRYLDKVEEIIAKSANGSVTQAELMMVNTLDLAELRRYEGAESYLRIFLKNGL